VVGVRVGVSVGVWVGVVVVVVVGFGVGVVVGVGVGVGVGVAVAVVVAVVVAVGVAMSQCPSCKNEFVQPFVCATCGAEKLYDATLKTVQDQSDVWEANAKRLALNLECLLLSCKDTAAVSKWWDSAHDSLELHRELCDKTYFNIAIKEIN